MYAAKASRVHTRCTIRYTPTSKVLGSHRPVSASLWRSPRFVLWQRGCVVQAIGDDGKAEEGDSSYSDIDDLADRLAAEAEKMRQKEASETEGEDTWEESSSEGEDDGPVTDDRAEGLSTIGSAYAFNKDDAMSFKQILDSLGDGGFFSSDFEILQELGSLSIQETEASVERGSFPGASQRRQRPAVIAYVASFTSGMPFQDPVVVLLKEYLPRASLIACNELVILKRLTGMPSFEEKWQSATALISKNPPVVELLGYFTAGSSERAIASDIEPGDPPSSRNDPVEAVWVVQKWQDMAPLTLYPQTQQISGIGLGTLFGRSERSNRYNMLRAICRGLLNSLGYCHDRCVVHGSLGSGSFLLSTFNDKDWNRLIVKIDNFGFARYVQFSESSPSRDGENAEHAEAFKGDTPLAIGCREDMKQLAVILLEVVLSSLAEDGPSKSTDGEAVQRLLCDVYDWDVNRYKDYMMSVPEWHAASELLDEDEGAGWSLLRDLVDGNSRASDLANCEFCNVSSL